MARIQVPMSPLAEQRALVARLDGLTERTRQVEAHLEAVEQIAPSLMLGLNRNLAGNRIVGRGDVVELSESVETVIPTETYPQVGVRGFGRGLFPKTAITGAETSYRAFNRLYQGALVLSQVKGWEGAIARCPRELEGWFVSPEYRTFRCRPALASDEYLGELVRTGWFWQRLKGATHGVGARREHTRPEQFLNIALPLPQIHHQRKAVELIRKQAVLNTEHLAIRAANAALLPAILERTFSIAAPRHT